MAWNMGWKRLGVALIAVMALGAVFAWRTAAPASATALFPMTIATPVQLSAGALFVAHQQQLLQQQGLSVELKRFLLGKQALQAVIDGSADVAIVADTPFALAVLRGEPIAALGTVYESRKTIAIVGRRDAGIGDVASLESKRVGTVLGTNAEFFLDTMLEVHGVSRSMVHAVNFKPDQLAAAFRDRKVDAVVVWNPELARLEQEFGAQAVTIYGEDLFVYRFLLVAKRSYIDTHGPQVRQLLAALRQGNEIIKESPDRTRTELGTLIGLAPDLLRHSFDPTDYTLVLDQSLLLALSAQMRWAVDKDLAPQGPAPDYQDYVRAGPLTTVAPDANRIIR